MESKETEESNVRIIVLGIFFFFKEGNNTIDRDGIKMNFSLMDSIVAIISQ